jgi:hypothetical protein
MPANPHPIYRKRIVRIKLSIPITIPLMLVRYIFCMLIRMETKIVKEVAIKKIKRPILRTRVAVCVSSGGTFINETKNCVNKNPIIVKIKLNNIYNPSPVLTNLFNLSNFF